MNCKRQSTYLLSTVIRQFSCTRLSGVSCGVNIVKKPPAATIEFTDGKSYTLEELQAQITKEAGDYQILAAEQA